MGYGDPIKRVTVELSLDELHEVAEALKPAWREGFALRDYFVALARRYEHDRWLAGHT